MFVLVMNISSHLIGLMDKYFKRLPFNRLNKKKITEITKFITNDCIQVIVTLFPRFLTEKSLYLSLKHEYLGIIYC